jgi:hypothetical protein
MGGVRDSFRGFEVLARGRNGLAPPEMQPRAILSGQSSLHGGKPRGGGLHGMAAILAASHCSTGTSPVVAFETAQLLRRFCHGPAGCR